MNIVGVGFRMKTDFFVFFLHTNLFFLLVKEGFFNYNAFLTLVLKKKVLGKFFKLLFEFLSLILALYTKWDGYSLKNMVVLGQ